MYPRILQKIDNFIVKTVNKYANFRWYNSPLTKKILANKEEYLQIWETAKNKKYLLIDDFEKKYNEQINFEWYNKLALHTQVVIKKSDIVYVHGRLLYTSLANYIKTNNLHSYNVLETGTARGFSAICMAKALQDNNKEGKIITFDVLPHNIKMYWNCIDDNQQKKTRAELLVKYNDLIERYIIFYQGNTKIELPKIQTPRIHFAFLDSAHEYYYLISEFLNIADKQIKGDIVFFDDYTPTKFPGVVRAIDEICRKYNYSKEIITISNERGYVVAKKL